MNGLLDTLQGMASQKLEHAYEVPYARARSQPRFEIAPQISTRDFSVGVAGRQNFGVNR